MKHCPRTIFGIGFVILASLNHAHGSPPPTDVSSLAAAQGYLIAGTFSGKIFASPDSGISWSDVSFGLCDSSSPTYQKMIKCMKVTRDDTIRAITACGEFVAAVPYFHWKQTSNDSCVIEYCAGCLMANTYYTALDRWMIKAFITGPIEWSSDSGRTWTVAVPGCSVCSMPIITSLSFDTISALAGLYGGYGAQIGYSSGIIMSTDSGRTWHATGFAPVDQGVRSITRIGSIAFAGTTNGIYASRDNFATWWLLGESSSVKKPGLSVPCKSVGNNQAVRRFTLTGRLLGRGERTYGNQVVVEIRPDGTTRYMRICQE